MRGAGVVLEEDGDWEVDKVEFFLISSNLLLIHSFNRYFFSKSSEGYID